MNDSLLAFKLVISRTGRSEEVLASSLVAEHTLMAGLTRR